jgi:light-harvesting complex I chlorophyll a/b binding protein 4
VQELQTKEIKNARLAMVAFVGFIVAAQATGQVRSRIASRMINFSVIGLE